MSPLSDAFRAHPLDLEHRQPDLNSLQEVTESYAWIQGNEYVSSGDSSTVETVPIIDLTKPNATQLIGHACRGWGVFQVINHGIPSSLFDNVEGVANNLFSLPTQQKLKAARSPDGVSGYGTARISSFFPKLMWYEGFTIVGSPAEHFRQLWPQDYTTYCETVEEYEKQVNHLSKRLLMLMLNALGLVKEDIKWAGQNSNFTGACAAIQLNSYPVCPDPDKAMGLAGHTDSTLLTVLHQSNTSGLQVFREGFGWVNVPPVQGALVVNVGDLLHILTNGLYPSVLHRVRVNRVKKRFSVAYLYGPPGDAEISPHPNFYGPKCPPLYRPVTWKEYLIIKAKLFDKALPSVSRSSTTTARTP